MTAETRPPETPPPGAPCPGLPGATHGSLRTGDGSFHYVVGGSGPAVVLLHGFPFTWEVWKPLFPLLMEAGYTVVAPDLRGLGCSEKTVGGYDKATVAGDVRAIVRSLGFPSIRLVGADIGAMAAFAYASRHPDEVKRLVFAESLIPGFGLEELMNPATGGYWHFGFHAQVEVATMLTQGREEAYLLPWYVMTSARDDAVAKAEGTFLPFYRAPGGMRAGFRHYEALLDDGRENRARFEGKSKTPTLVLNGERGLPQAQTLRSVERAFESVEADVVPGAGHVFASDEPEWTAARLLRFFAPGAEGVR